MRDIDCTVFMDQLDSLLSGALAEENVRLLQHHADACPDCREILRVKTQLSEPTQDVLEAMVPDGMVNSMYANVEGALARRRAQAQESAVTGAQRPGGWLSGRTLRWLVPAQAAAVVLLAIGVVFLYTQVEALRQREASLVARLDDRLGGEAVFGASTETDRRESSRHGTGRGSGDGATVADLTRRLSELPPGADVADSKTAARMLRAIQRSDPRIDEAQLRGIDPHDGLQAGEALELIEMLGLDPGDRRPARWMRSFSARGAL